MRDDSVWWWSWTKAGSKSRMEHWRHQLALAAGNVCLAQPTRIQSAVLRWIEGDRRLKELEACQPVLRPAGKSFVYFFTWRNIRPFVPWLHFVCMWVYFSCDFCGCISWPHSTYLAAIQQCVGAEPDGSTGPALCLCERRDSGGSVSLLISISLFNTPTLFLFFCLSHSCCSTDLEQSCQRSNTMDTTLCWSVAIHPTWMASSFTLHGLNCTWCWGNLSAVITASSERALRQSLVMVADLCWSWGWVLPLRLRELLLYGTGFVLTCVVMVTQEKVFPSCCCKAAHYCLCSHTTLQTEKEQYEACTQWVCGSLLEMWLKTWKTSFDQKYRKEIWHSRTLQCWLVAFCFRSLLWHGFLKTVHYLSNQWTEQVSSQLMNAVEHLAKQLKTQRDFQPHSSMQGSEMQLHMNANVGPCWCEVFDSPMYIAPLSHHIQTSSLPLAWRCCSVMMISLCHWGALLLTSGPQGFLALNSSLIGLYWLYGHKKQAFYVCVLFFFFWFGAKWTLNNVNFCIVNTYRMGRGHH